MEDNTPTRRRVLKTLGSTAALGVLAGQGAASSEENTTTLSEKAEKAFRESVKQHHEASRSSNKISPQEVIDPRADVYVGQDTTLNPDYGDKFESDDTDSWQDAVLNASYNTTADRIEARAWDLVGYGTFEAWSYIGREFVAHGSGTATITTRPYLSATIGYRNASGSLSLKLDVWDYTDNLHWDDTIISTSAVRNFDEEFVQSHDVSLEDGHAYGVQVRLAASTTVTGAGDAHVDVTDENGGDHHVDVGSFDVTF